jgi:hypothetical protein
VPFMAVFRGIGRVIQRRAPLTPHLEQRL